MADFSAARLFTAMSKAKKKSTKTAKKQVDQPEVQEKKKVGRPRGKDSIAWLREHPEALGWSIAEIAEGVQMNPRMVAYQLWIASRDNVLKRRSMLVFVDGDGGA